MICSLQVWGQEDPYHRNKKDENKKSGTNRPSEQNQDGELKEKVSPNYQSSGSSQINSNAEALNAIGSIANSLLMISDNYTGEPTFLKMQIGIGLSQQPLVVNAVNYSTTERIHTLGLLFGLNLGILKKSAISFNLKPYYSFKTPEIIKGNKGVISEYGGDLIGYFASQAESKFKLFVHSGYRKVSGNFQSDGTNGDPFTSKLNYGVIKFGGGLIYHTIVDNKEFWIKPGLFLEKPSFLLAEQSPIKTINLNINILSEVEIDFSISQNTFIGGQVNYPKQFINKNQTFYNITLIRNGKLF